MATIVHDRSGKEHHCVSSRAAASLVHRVEATRRLRTTHTGRIGSLDDPFAALAKPVIVLAILVSLAALALHFARMLGLLCCQAMLSQIAGPVP
jgi:hypothetical protein